MHFYCSALDRFKNSTFRTIKWQIPKLEMKIIAQHVIKINGRTKMTRCSCHDMITGRSPNLSKLLQRGLIFSAYGASTSWWWSGNPRPRAYIYAYMIIIYVYTCMCIKKQKEINTWRTAALKTSNRAALASFLPWRINSNLPKRQNNDQTSSFCHVLSLFYHVVFSCFIVSNLHHFVTFLLSCFIIFYHFWKSWKISHPNPVKKWYFNDTSNDNLQITPYRTTLSYDK